MGEMHGPNVEGVEMHGRMLAWIQFLDMAPHLQFHSKQALGEIPRQRFALNEFNEEDLVFNNGDSTSWRAGWWGRVSLLDSPGISCNHLCLISCGHILFSCYF